MPICANNSNIKDEECDKSKISEMKMPKQQKCQNRILITQKKLSLVQNKEQPFLLKLVLQCVTL